MLRTAVIRQAAGLAARYRLAGEHRLFAAAQRYAARGTPLVGDMADLEIGQQEDVATQRVAAA
eukprot:COSAG06_NODE_44181_length_365_cov_1.424812_1_plen_62_part_10